jgi:Rrf2 family protein
MKISTKTRHALRMMLDFAEHRNDGYISLKDVSVRMGVSKAYLEQIMIQVSKTDFLAAVRGAAGGYKLARTPDKYTVGDILRAMEGGVSAGQSEGDADGNDRLSLMTADVWSGLETVMLDYLDKMNLQDILDKNSSYVGYDFSI